MSFASPWFLLALAVLPVAVWLRRLADRRAARHAIRFPGVDTLAAVSPSPGRLRSHLPLALFLAALAILAVALAKPERTVGVPVERASVTLVTDVSRSMKADDVQPSRLEAARRAGERFLDRAPKELRIGSVTFSDRPQVVESPSSDRDDARSVLDGLVADGGTATGEGLSVAIATLERDRGKGGRRTPAAILLLSDGESTIGRDPVGVARRAGQLGIPIYTVALGTESAVIEGPDGEPIPVPPDPETLRRIAQASGGKAFTAQQADQLDNVYEQLGSRIGQRRVKREMTAGFAGAGAVLLLLAAGAGLRLTGRFP
jgi:Ca-activated chloride channel homolog